jgi:hypothetical protein
MAPSAGCAKAELGSVNIDPGRWQVEEKFVGAVRGVQRVTHGPRQIHGMDDGSKPIVMQEADVEVAALIGNAALCRDGTVQRQRVLKEAK